MVVLLTLPGRAWRAGAFQIQALYGRVIASTSPSRMSRGLNLINASPKRPNDYVFERIELALELISEKCPSLYPRVSRGLTSIIVREQRNSEYWPGINACVLDLRSVTGESALGLATKIVHEATHARLWRIGHRYQSHRRERIEWICTRAELRFLKSIPNTTDIQQLLLDRLRDRWWTEEAMTNHYVQRLKNLGAPPWFVGAFRTVRNWARALRG